jgi:hypothetical protein
LVRHHRVYPVVASVLRQYADVPIPQQVLDTLKQMYYQNTLQMLQLTAEMERVCHALQQHDIRVIVLKGPVLAEGLYGDFSLRVSKDIDLLVSEDQFDQAEKIIEQMGYVSDLAIPRILNDVKRKTHNLGYTNAQKGVQIELHWRMDPNTIKEPTFSELWERRQSTKQTSQPIYFLGQEDLFSFLILHGARHGWFRLRWLSDIDRLARMEMDWTVIKEEFKQNENLYILGQAMQLVSDLFYSPLGAEHRSLMKNRRSQRLAIEAKNIIADILLKVDQPNSKDVEINYKFYFKLLMSKRQRWNQAMNKLYPSSHDAQLLPLPKWLHFLYFPLRPFLWAWRKKKQQASA